MADFIPHTIFTDHIQSQTCSQDVPLDVDLPDAVYNISSEDDDVMIAYLQRSTPFNLVVVALESFKLVYQECISGYSGLISALDTEMISTNMTTNFAIGDGFVFDASAESLLNTLDWLSSDIMAGYIANTVSKQNMTRLLDAATTLQISNYAQSLVTDIKTQISTPLRETLQNDKSLFRKKYLYALEILYRFQIHYPDRAEYYRSLARKMNIWLKPETQLDGLTLVTLTIPSSDIWRTWPTYMDLYTFMQNQAANLLGGVAYAVIDVLLEELSEAEDKLAAYASEIETSLNYVNTMLQDFEAVLAIDEAFVQ